MNLNVYTVSFCGILIVRDEDGNETSRRVAAAPRDVTVASNTQNEAVDYAKRTLPDGLEINVQHVVQVANAVEIVGAAAAGEDLVVENEQLKAKLADLEQSSGLAIFELKAELKLTQDAFAASQQKPDPPPAHQGWSDEGIGAAIPGSGILLHGETLVAGRAEQSETVEVDKNPNLAPIVDVKVSTSSEPPLDQQLATVEIPSEFDKPIGETPAQGSAPTTS